MRSITLYLILISLVNVRADTPATAQVHPHDVNGISISMNIAQVAAALGEDFPARTDNGETSLSKFLHIIKKNKWEGYAIVTAQFIDGVTGKLEFQAESMNGNLLDATEKKLVDKHGQPSKRGEKTILETKERELEWVWTDGPERTAFNLLAVIAYNSTTNITALKLILSNDSLTAILMKERDQRNRRFNNLKQEHERLTAEKALSKLKP